MHFYYLAVLLSSCLRLVSYRAKLLSYYLAVLIKQFLLTSRDRWTDTLTSLSIAKHL